MVAAAFIGPGTVTTATIAGSSFGYTLLWAVLFSIFATYILQEMSARLGVVGGMGVGEAIRQKATGKGLKIPSAILVIGAILVGNAAYEAGNISGATLGFSEYAGQLKTWPVNPFTLGVGALAFALLFGGKYRLIERSLIALVSIMGIVFIIAAIAAKPDFGLALKGMLIPSIPSEPEGGWLMVVGLIGTTVVPYNLFLHASSAKKRWSGEKDLPASRSDTSISVVLGGVITMMILIAAAAVLQGKTVTSASELAGGLQPLLKDWATPVLALGFFAAGISSSITAPLAAAFATSETLGWKDDLKGGKFRMVWIFVLLIGIVFSTLGFKPTAVILFAQVANGLLLPIVAAFLLWIMNDRKIMGSHTNSKLVNAFGILVILITIGLGLRGILKAAGV